MKLCIILSIEDYADEVRKILSSQKVPAYSETSIYGFRSEGRDFPVNHWFPGDYSGTYSNLFFSFQDKEVVAKIFQELKKFNKSLKPDESQNPVHGFMLNVEDKV